MNDIEYHLKYVWISDLPKRKKFLNFAKLYNKNLSNIIIADDIINIIVSKIKTI
tara:strand:+ start:940 stop:1101 length:162 start_codon:yes stop_codon:yes gene_type:complete